MKKQIINGVSNPEDLAPELHVYKGVFKLIRSVPNKDYTMLHLVGAYFNEKNQRETLFFTAYLDETLEKLEPRTIYTGELHYYIKKHVYKEKIYLNYMVKKYTIEDSQYIGYTN